MEAAPWQVLAEDGFPLLLGVPQDLPPSLTATSVDPTLDNQ